MLQRAILAPLANIKPLENITNEALTSENPLKAKLTLWVIWVFSLLAVTAISVFGLFALTSSYRPGIVVSTILWACFFGVCSVFFLSPKLLTTFFGSILGVGASEISSANGIITKANATISETARQINTIVDEKSTSTDPFIGWMIWIFVIIIALICLPAFFTDEA